MHALKFNPRPARRIRLLITILAGALLAALAVGGLQPAGAKGGGGGGGTALASLSTLPVPTPPDVQRFIKDNAAAQKLGKALFWDMQAGSDGRQACASCHYSAGADNRSRNQINPRGGGFSFRGKAANAQLTADDFPLHQLVNPDDAASAVSFDTDNVVGSQGVLPSHFTGVSAGNALDLQSFDPLDPDFHVGSVNVRRSTGRNTPSVINAVFNNRNFWDGRAQNEFNGVNPFGSRDAGATVGQANAAGGIDQVAVSIANSSLASQADGPPGNPVEMSSDGRTLSDIGKKLLSVRPLGTQQVSRTDSLLGGDVTAAGRGLNSSYADMIRAAFQPEWWNADGSVTTPNSRTYSLMQFNFPLFWGLAIQAYESTLVSDQAPVDKFLAGDTSALGAQAQQGMGVFSGKGGCESCHEGPAFTDATVANVAAKGVASATGDTGFHNIGVRPTATDSGNGGSDPFGQPLSASLLGGQAGTNVQGSFKTPDLRNVALTAPYFHNGGELTLRQVVDFYGRGGDFANPEKSITALGLSSADKDALVAFLESLTDPRVRDQSAPFDHPQLFVAAGEQTNADGSIVTDASGRAADCFKEVPATGAGGGAPLARFPSFTGPPCDTAPALEAAAQPAAPPASHVETNTQTSVKPGAKPDCSGAQWITRLGRHARVGLIGMAGSRVVACLGRPTGAVRSGSRQRWRYGKGLVLRLVNNRVTSLTVRSRKYAGAHGIGYGTSLARVRRALGRTAYDRRAAAWRAVIRVSSTRYASIQVRSARSKVTRIDVTQVSASSLDSLGRRLAAKR